MENQIMEQPQSRPTASLALLDELGRQLQRSFDNSEEIDQDRCYLMEIEQLRRQNNFLKRKIAELTRSSKRPALSKRSSLPLNAKTISLVVPQSQQNYIIGFFEEITRLLQGFSSLFKCEQGVSFHKQLNKENEETNWLAAEKEEDMGQRLGRMLLEPEDKRYGMLLEIFEDHYRQGKERKEALRSKVEEMTKEAIELGKQMIENVRKREKLRSSHIFSQAEFSLHSALMKSGMGNSEIICDSYR